LDLDGNLSNNDFYNKSSNIVNNLRDLNDCTKFFEREEYDTLSRKEDARRILQIGHK
jgi:hypothetical protein